MNKYINGYLSTIPKMEKEKILLTLKNILKSKYTLNDEELNMAMSKLMNENSKITHPITVSASGKPSDALAAFVKDIDSDILNILTTINLIDSSIESVKAVVASTNRELINELNALEDFILEQSIKASKNEIVIVENFKNNENLEDRNDDTEILFKDHRLNDKIPTADFKISDNVSKIILNNTRSESVTHKDGKLIANIELIDYIGQPFRESNIKNVFDRKSFSFYDLSTRQDIPLQNEIDNFSLGGAYSKIKIVLPAKRKVSNFEFTSIASTPIEICAIYIEGINILEEPIIINNEFKIALKSTSQAIFKTLEIDEITFLIRQVNYKKETIKEYPMIEAIINEEDLILKFKKTFKSIIDKIMYRR